MTRIGRSLKGWTGGLLDLPQDLLSDMPRITLIGNREMIIENHRGVLHFSPGQLKLALAKGSLEIVGEDLVVTSILGKELTLTGIICEIRYKESGESR
ncbi:sporulation protein YqfC [Paenibacillus stellifer]|uniref:Sporulation protein YqfC n=1 Tax=Paenibacillus stellifer TaxID=169760 RepID=A0A089LU16_9BACL|nr:sporulation protein YqfC [Paenibacillus stellifer]AIQ65016.1 sporulation protein YqfC [Paenibacillus stellifer]